MTWCKRVRDVVVAGWCVSNEQRFSDEVLRNIQYSNAQARPANGRIPVMPVISSCQSMLYDEVSS